MHVGSRGRARASLQAHSLIDCEPIGFRNNGSYKRTDAPADQPVKCRMTARRPRTGVLIF